MAGSDWPSKVEVRRGPGKRPSVALSPSERAGLRRLRWWFSVPGMAADRPCLAFYRPDIPGNLGAALRLAACLDVDVHVIEPCGFPLASPRLRRAGLDYADRARLARLPDLDALVASCQREARRLLHLGPRGPVPYHAFGYRCSDVLLLGPESGPVPEEVERRADAVVRIPMSAGSRSLNVVVAAAIVLGELMRQTGLMDALGQRASGLEEGVPA